MTDKDIEEMMKVCETQVGELIYVLAGKDFNASADLLNDMSERLSAQATEDRERARKYPGRVMS